MTTRATYDAPMGCLTKLSSLGSTTPPFGPVEACACRDMGTSTGPVRTDIGLPPHMKIVMVLIWAALAATTPALATDPIETTTAALGEQLFFDTRLSADGKVSCATCHRPDHAFSDGLPVATGTTGLHGTRNTPSLLDVAQQHSLFWDGRRPSLESQSLDPMLNPVEHGLRDEADLLARVRADDRYASAFRALWGVDANGTTPQHMAQALAAYERTLVSAATPFDRFRAGDTAALPLQARRGWQLFSDRAQCTRCHAVEGNRPLFTDHQFHSLAVGLRRIERKLPALTERLVQWRSEGRPVDHVLLNDADVAALGRFVFTLAPADIGKFKTPVLRNVALTAPYMHDGSVATLTDAVELELYYRGTQDGRPLILTPSEREDLVAFLNALTSDVPTGSVVDSSK